MKAARFVLALFAIALPHWASALGLGEAEVFSSLNQALDARIELVAADRVDLAGFKVGLFREESALASSAYSFPLENLRFRLVEPDKGRPYIHVTSTRSVREPFLTFTLEMKGKGGYLRREYTFLLDPLPVRQTRPARLAPSRRAASPAQQQQDAQAENRGGGVYGPVRGGETLSSIALRTRPGKGVSLQKMIQALYRKNPQAFIRGNINLLKRGARLTIPSADEIEQAAAYRPVARRQPPARPAPAAVARGGEDVAAATSPDGAQRPPVAVERAPKVDDEKLFRLLSADEEAKMSPDQVAKERARLKQELKDVNQELETVKAENADLRQRMQAFQQQLQLLREEILRVNEEERQVVEQLAQKQQQAARQPRVVAPEKPPETPEKPFKVAVEAPPAPAPVEPPAPPASRRAPIDWVVWAQIGGGVLGVILLIVLLLRMRGKSSDADQAPKLLRDEDEVVRPHHTISSIVVDMEEATREENSEILSDSEMLLEPKPQKPKTLDRLRTEVEMNIVYGRYADAQAALDEALGRAPEDQELLIKALELALLREDEEAFVGWVKRVGAGLATQLPDVWADIYKRGIGWLPDHPVWQSLNSGVEDEGAGRPAVRDGGDGSGLERESLFETVPEHDEDLADEELSRVLEELEDLGDLDLDLDHDEDEGQPVDLDDLAPGEKRE